MTFADQLQALRTLAVILTCGAIGYAGLEAGLLFRHLDAQAKQAPSITATVTKLNQTLDDSHRILVETGLTSAETRKATATLNKSLPTILTGVQNAVTGLNAASAALTGTASQATTTLASVGSDAHGTFAATQTAFAGVAPVLTHLDAVVSDSAIPASLANVQAATAQLTIDERALLEIEQRAETTEDLTNSGIRSFQHGWLYRIFAKVF